MLDPLFVRRLLRGLFFAACVVAFVMAVLPKPPSLVFETSDKFQHIAAFAVLAVLARVAYLEAQAIHVFLSLSAFGALIECAQLIPMLGRDADIVDWLADNIAVLTVLLVGKAWQYWARVRTY